MVLRRTRRSRCKRCVACLAKKCGECKFCLDNQGPKRLKQTCEKRRCIFIQEKTYGERNYSGDQGIAGVGPGKMPIRKKTVQRMPVQSRAEGSGVLSGNSIVQSSTGAKISGMGGPGSERKNYSAAQYASARQPYEAPPPMAPPPGTFPNRSMYQAPATYTPTDPRANAPYAFQQQRIVPGYVQSQGAPIEADLYRGDSGSAQPTSPYTHLRGPPAPIGAPPPTRRMEGYGMRRGVPGWAEASHRVRTQTNPAAGPAYTYFSRGRLVPAWASINHGNVANRPGQTSRVADFRSGLVGQKRNWDSLDQPPLFNGTDRKTTRPRPNPARDIRNRRDAPEAVPSPLQQGSAATRAGPAPTTRDLKPNLSSTASPIAPATQPGISAVGSGVAIRKTPATEPGVLSGTAPPLKANSTATTAPKAEPNQIGTTNQGMETSPVSGTAAGKDHSVQPPQSHVK